MASPFFFGCWRDRPDSNRSLDSPRSNSELALCKKMDDSSYATSFSKPPGSEEPHNSSCETSPFYSVAINHLGTSSGKKQLHWTERTKQAICGWSWIEFPSKKQVSNELSSVQWSVPTVATKSLIEHVQMSSLEPVDPLKKQWVCLNMFEHVWTCLNIAGKTSNAYYGLSSWSLMCAIRTGVKWGIHRYPPCLDKPRIWTHTKFTLPSVSGANCQCFK